MSKATTALVALIADFAFGSESVALLIVAVPEFAPNARVVAAPPMLRVVAPVLKRFPVDAVVVNEPLLTAAVPAVVILPLEPVTEKLVPTRFDAPRLIPVTIWVHLKDQYQW